MEENRPWWGARTSNPSGAVRLSQVGSTPTLFRQRPSRTFASNIVFLSDEQQRVGCVASPACLANQKIEPERRKVVGEWVHLHVVSLVQHLRVGMALIAGLGLYRSRTAVNLLQGERARLAAGDAHSPHIIPSRRAKRTI